MSAGGGPTLERLAGDAWLLRLGDRVDPVVNARVHRLSTAIRAAAPPWLVDLVPAYASLGVFFDPATADAQAVRGWLSRMRAPPPGPDGAPGEDPRPVVEVPVVYGGRDGPDLAAAAAELGITAAELAERHAAGAYVVAMVGFAPGFPYLSGLDPALALPRLATPRTRVPAGSVAIAGAQAGIYPGEGPGGWRLLGRTPLRLFDPAREPPALLAPGDRVRFTAVAAGSATPIKAGAPAVARSDANAPRANDPRDAVDVLAPGLLTTVQDEGRVGWRHLGVGLAGALDTASAALANAMVGNPPGAAVLECTLQGPALRLPRPVRVAICGGGVEARFEDTGGRHHAVPGQRPVDLPAGVLHVGALATGARAWLAIAGGIDVPPVLGSRSTDLRGGFGGFGGRALRRGDRLALGDAGHPANPVSGAPEASAWWIDPWSGVPRLAPIRFLPAGRTAARALSGHGWQVDARGNRQGVRFAGEPLSARSADGVSEPVAPGTVQLPPDGQPIVLLADAQSTGGYPRLGHVVPADLPRLAQARPGDALRFEAVDARRAAALAAERRALLARLHLAIEARLR